MSEVNKEHKFIVVMDSIGNASDIIENTIFNVTTTGNATMIIADSREDIKAAAYSSYTEATEESAVEYTAKRLTDIEKDSKVTIRKR